MGKLIVILLWIFILFGDALKYSKNTKTRTFYCFLPDKAVKKRATGWIHVSRDAKIIKYKYKGIEHILTNATCDFGLASDNVVIDL